MDNSSEQSLCSDQQEKITRHDDSPDAKTVGGEEGVVDHANGVVDITPIDRLSRADSQKHELGHVASLPRRRKSPKRRPSGLTGLSEPLLDDEGGGDLDDSNSALPWEDGGNDEPEPEGRVGWVYASAMVR